MSNAGWEADRQAWQLTNAQFARYLARISEYHRNRAARLADLSMRYARTAERLSMVGLVLAVIGFAVAVAAVLW